MSDWPRQSPLDVALRGACPRCGRGRLFRGLLGVVERCSECGLDLRGNDAGDGPAVFVILGLGAIIMILEFWVEFRFEPPWWVHVLIWGPLTVGPALWPTLISLPIFVVSLGLAVWQMERREWKRDILHRIEVNQAAAPITLDELLRGNPLRQEYGRVTVAGTLLNDKEFYLAARNLKNKVGLQVVTPLRTDDGRIVLFDRGWIPQEQKDPAKRAQGQAAGRLDLTGIVRRNQERRQFAPENVPDKNVWFHVDVPLMRGMAGGKPDPKLDTFFLDADAAPNPGGLPIGGQTRLDIPNDHLQYAITWLLLALAMAGVYLAYHWENGRLTVAGRTKVRPKDGP